jgi:hypothetical protein
MSEATTQTIKNVIFYYTSVSKPEKQLNPENKAPKSEHPLEGYSYEVKILITEDRYKKLKKTFKGAKNFDKAKELDIDECLAMGETVTEDMVLITFRQTACIGKTIKRDDGTTTRKESRLIPQFGIKGKVQDKHGLTIDADTNLGYGTQGHFQFRPVRNDFGLYLYPNALCITQLVEFAGGDEDSIDEDAFDFEALDEVDINAVESSESEGSLDADEIF